MFSWEKMKMGRNRFNILRVFMWKKELSVSALVNIMSSSGWNLQGGRFSELCDIRIVDKQNEMPYLNVNSLKIAAIYNADSTQNTVLGT